MRSHGGPSAYRGRQYMVFVHSWWWDLIWQAFAHHDKLSLPFLDHVVGVLNRVPVFKDDDVDKADPSSNLALPHTLNQRPLAATLALGAIFRYFPNPIIGLRNKVLIWDWVVFVLVFLIWIPDMANI